MKKTTTFIFLMALMMLSAPAFPAKNYLYRHRANWVKLEKLSNKQLAGEQLHHPYQSISSEQMAAMLLSITINKGKLFKSEKETLQIFSSEEASQYAPLLVQALAQATPNQVVNMAVVHKRPYFIVRNDLISVVNVFVQGSELHFNFTKIFAKLEGDYKQASRLDRAVSNAKGIRTNLVTMPGQTLTADGREIILDLGHDFLADAAAAGESSVQTTAGETSKASDVVSQETIATAQQGDVTARLKKLEELRKERLITEAEYQEKKFKILDEL